MDPFLRGIESASAEVQLNTLFRLADMAPEAAIALLIAVLLAVYGLVRSDLRTHLPLPR